MCTFFANRVFVCLLIVLRKEKHVILYQGVIFFVNIRYKDIQMTFMKDCLLKVKLI